MRKIVSLVMFILWVSAQPVKVEKIEIFPGGARIYMSSIADATGKANFGPLPLDAKDFICSHPDFSVEERINPSLPQEAIRLRENYEKLKSALKSLDAKIEDLKLRLGFHQKALDKLSESFSRRPAPGWEKLAESLSLRISVLKKKIYSLQVQRRALAPRVELAEKKWKEIEPRMEKAKFVEVKAKPGERVYLSLNTSSLSYAFFYRVDVNLEKPEVVIKAYCNISSSFPSDLRGKVSLLPERPSFYIPLPHQRRWDISLWRPRPYPKRYLKKRLSFEAGLMASSPTPAPAPRTVGLYRVVILGEKSIRFGRNNIKIFSSPLVGKLTWEAYPAVSSKVFVVFRGKNTTGFHLPPARVLFFLDGIFSREDKLPSIAQNEKFTLAMATDPNFSVKYERRVMERNKGIMKSGILIERHVIIENGGDKGREILVRIPLPYPVDKEIKVKYRLEPAPVSINKDKIGLWKLPLKPGGSAKINLEFKIVFPKGKKITGIDIF